MTILCSDIRHRWGETNEGGHEEIYYAAGPDGPLILFRQPIQPGKPSQTPPADVGAENGWCVPGQVEQAQTVESAPAEVRSQPATANHAGLIVMGGAGLFLLGLMGLALAISYRIKPDPTLRLPGQAHQPLLLPPPVAEGEPMAVPPMTPAQQQYTPLVTTPDAVTAYSRLLSAPFVSRAFFGTQRTGKSYLLACVAQQLAAAGIKVFWLNLSSYDSEDQRYTKHCHRSVLADLAEMPDIKATETIARAKKLVNEFYATNGAVLIVDEWVTMARTTNGHAGKLTPLVSLIADKIATLASTGMKRQKAIWTLSPDMTAGDLSQAGKAIKNLKLAVVAIAPGVTVQWQGQPISFDADLLRSLKNNFVAPDMPQATGELAATERIAYVDGYWMPVGVDGSTLNAPLTVQAIATEQTDPDDFYSPVTEALTAAANGKGPLSLWDRYKPELLVETPAFQPLIEWIEGLQGQSFTLDRAAGNGSLRAKLTPLSNEWGCSQRDGVKNAVLRLHSDGLLQRNGESFQQA